MHLIAVPRLPHSLPLALKHTHGRYAAYFNARYGSSGHVWQGRYYSCPLNTPHLWTALRYTELNPVRARMVTHAQDYRWSTAAAHCGLIALEAWLDPNLFTTVWTPALWREYLTAEDAQEDLAAIRQNTHTGRPLGSPDFVANLEKLLRRNLAPAKGGRPPKECPDERQHRLTFGLD